MNSSPSVSRIAAPSRSRSAIPCQDAASTALPIIRKLAMRLCHSSSLLSGTPIVSFYDI